MEATKKEHPNIKTPCNQCPFRKDTISGWLNERAHEIAEAESFVCHKTLNTKLKQCAGFILLVGDQSLMSRVAKVLKFDLELSGSELVFDSKRDFIEHHGGKN